jgi:small multidrug resistance pump
MLTFIAKINPGVIWLLFAIATDVLSTFILPKQMD